MRDIDCNTPIQNYLSVNLSFNRMWCNTRRYTFLRSMIPSVDDQDVHTWYTIIGSISKGNRVFDLHEARC